MRGDDAWQFKALGSSLEIRYGIHDTALGRVMLGVTERGICWLAFIAGDGRPADEEFSQAWAGATLIHDQEATAPWIERAFDIENLGKKPLPLLIRGTNFQIKVWEALLRIPFGRLVTYQDVAEAIGNPKAVRAVGGAVGKNNISWLIPCHRVILSSGVMHNYRWGVRQKKILERLGGRHDRRGRCVNLGRAAHPAHGVQPAVIEALAFGIGHGGLEATVELPSIADGILGAVETGLQAGEIGGAERGGLDHLRTLDRQVQDIRQELADPVIGDHAAIDANGFGPTSPWMSLSIAFIRSLV